MGRKLKLITLITKAVASAVIFFCTMLTIWTVGPAIETAFFPAVSKLRIISERSLSDGTTELYVSYNKLRGECDYIGLAWYYGDRNAEFGRASVILGRKPGDTSSPNRPKGQQTSGPWTIGLTLDELKNHSFAQLSHRCHPFWTTTTDFFP